MTFRDQAIADLPAFLNVVEFGDTITIGAAADPLHGVPMACVLVNDEAPTDDEGVSMLESTLYARASDFAAPPVVRQRLAVGARLATIIRVDEEQGMLVIRLRWFNS
jgi:hypothetical protein